MKNNNLCLMNKRKDTFGLANTRNADMNQIRFSFNLAKCANKITKNISFFMK